MIKCTFCGANATCFGRYKDNQCGYACDKCCKHTEADEAGWCEPLETGKSREITPDMVGWLRSLLADIDSGRLKSNFATAEVIIRFPCGSSLDECLREIRKLCDTLTEMYPESAPEPALPVGEEVPY